MNPEKQAQVEKVKKLVYDVIDKDSDPILVFAAIDALAAMEDEPLTKATQDVLVERRRRVLVEGWTPEHDDEHNTGGMAFAAAAYAVSSAARKGSLFTSTIWTWTGWSSKWFKPKTPREDLIRAGALILAEIERLDRAET